MSEFAKGEWEFLNVLMRAWVAGWYAGQRGDMVDDRKRTDCPELMKQHPKQATAPDLYEACKVAREWLNSGIVQEAIQYEDDFESIVPMLDEVLAKADKK